jgi:hypothetical protein
MHPPCIGTLKKAFSFRKNARTFRHLLFIDQTECPFERIYSEL